MRLLPQRRRRNDHSLDHRRFELIAPASRSPRKEPPGSFFYRAGFSLVELVVIILILGVISVFVGVRNSDTVARTRAFYDELLSQVQYGRKVAVAQRRAVFVVIGTTQSRLCYAADCAVGVASPTGQVPFTVTAPTGVSVDAAATFQFDPLGRPRDATTAALWTAPLVLTVAGEGNYPFTIWHETGYVR